MGTKNSPGKFDCLAKAEADEPFFVLLARDPLAPSLVEFWAKLAAQSGAQPPEKVEEAVQLAAAMRRWRQGRDNG